MVKEKCKCGNGHTPPAGCLHNCYKCCAGKGGVLTSKSSSVSSGNLNRLRRGGFTNFEGVSVDDKNVNEIQKSILGLVSVGILFFVIGYSYSKGKEKA